MERKEIRPGNPIEVGEVTLIPVTKVLSGRYRRRSLATLYCLAQPVSVVVVTPNGKRAIGTDGKDIPLEPLIATVPGLKEALDSV